VQDVFGLAPEVVEAQLKSITDDFRVAFAKTGMLYSAKTTIAVAKHLHENEIPFVLDPVIEAEAGGRLLRPEAVLALKKHLIPLARVVTPNIFEAEALTGIHVSDIDSADAAAREILEMGLRRSSSRVDTWTAQICCARQGKRFAFLEKGWLAATTA